MERAPATNSEKVPVALVVLLPVPSDEFCCATNADSTLVAEVLVPKIFVDNPMLRRLGIGSSKTPAITVVVV